MSLNIEAKPEKRVTKAIIELENNKEWWHFNIASTFTKLRNPGDPSLYNIYACLERYFLFFKEVENDTKPLHVMHS